MANPQAEHGHIRIANEIWDKLIRAGLTGLEWDVVATVLRKTWGWGNKEAAISLRDFQQMTARDESAIRVALRSMQTKRLVIQTVAASFTGPAKWKFNKDWETWLISPWGSASPTHSMSGTHSLSNQGEGSASPTHPTVLPQHTPPDKSSSESQANQTDATARNLQKYTIKTNIKPKERSHAPNGGADPRFQPVVDFFFTAYQKHKGINFVPHDSEFKALKGLLQRTKGIPGFEIEGLQASIQRFLLSGDAFHQKQGRPLAYWADNISAFVGNGGNNGIAPAAVARGSARQAVGCQPKFFRD